METKIINANQILFRCSSLSHIMTDDRATTLTENQIEEIKELESKEKRTEKQQEKLNYLLAKKNAPPTLSDSCINHLSDVYVANKYGRRDDLENHYVKKGLMVEEDSLTLYSRYKKRIFTKNDEVLYNEFIKGCPDVRKEYIVDAKSNWDIFTFFRTNVKKLNKNYYWQMQGYMALTGAKSATLAYCLIDTPDVLIQDIKRKLLWDMGVATELDEKYLKACEEIDLLHKYEDIPLDERVIEIEIERNDEDIKRIYKRVEECRNYMNKHFFKI